jgi:mRNA-degrading endonuclease RelE of RelBE toxin-antitoxin system
LSEDPQPAEFEKLSGQEKYRLRRGDYRITVKSRMKR